MAMILKSIHELFFTDVNMVISIINGSVMKKHCENRLGS